MRTRSVIAVVFCLVLLSMMLPSAARADSRPAVAESNVTRATLNNDLRVVIVRDPLAPVVTVEQNYLVGANDTPAGFPGMAHAQEHMAFRGCYGLSADQTAAIFAQLGGDGDADTQQEITQYFETVPAQDLDVALHLDAECMRDIADSQEQWSEERGAIEQEVARDLSNPTYKFLTRLNEDVFAGTPYAHDALGTKGGSVAGKQSVPSRSLTSHPYLRTGRLSRRCLIQPASRTWSKSQKNSP
jgi:zinc protease